MNTRGTVGVPSSSPARMVERPCGDGTGLMEKVVAVLGKNCLRVPTGLCELRGRGYCRTAPFYLICKVIAQQAKLSGTLFLIWL